MTQQARNKFSLDDYIDVAERIQHFKEAYPEGSLQTLDWSVQDVAGQTFIVYRAVAYRDQQDRRPGHGIAWEPFPGKTPYTRDSELMNAETAAWGRAIVALGLTANRKLASRQEVRARSEAPDGDGNGATAPGQSLSDAIVTQEDIKGLREAARGLSLEQVQLAFTSLGLDKPTKEGTYALVPRAKASELAKKLAEVER